ncbi:MAG: hypothetical protein HRU29_11675 [Rhizobiales bacterium]|nr:host specificity factor TipJ family phage tail protein [Hyphomicrobiales bacterium]NRB15049.1 hypothetical protein [Hyphomicrobiales bacterium]
MSETYNNISVSYDPLLMFKINKISSRNFETIVDVFKRADYVKAGGVHYTKRVVTVCINGAWLPFKEWATRLIMPNDNVLFNMMPYGHGGGGGSSSEAAAAAGASGGGNKDILRIVAQIAVVAAATFFAPMIGGAMVGLGISAALGSQIAFAGIMFVGQLAVNALLPATQISQQEKDEVYSLSAAGNRAKIGSALPHVYGELKVFPEFCSKPYWSFENNEQFLYHWMYVTIGDADLSQFKLGDSLVGNFLGAEIYVFNKGRHKYVGDGVGGLAYTALAGLNNGDEHHLNDGSVPAYNNVWTAPEVSGSLELIAPNELENGHDGWYGGFAANPPDTALQKIELDFVFPRGLSNNGETSSNINVNIDAEYRLIDAHGGSIGVWNNLYTAASVITLSGASTEMIRLTRTFTVPNGTTWQGQRVEVRVKRTSNAATDNNISDQVNWTGMRGFLPNFKYADDRTIVCLKLKAAKEISSLATRNFSCLTQTKLNALSLSGLNDVAVAGATSTTNKPADIIFDALVQIICPDETVLANKLAKVLALVDLPTLVKHSETAIGEGARLDIKIDNKKPFWHWLEQLCLCMRVKPYMSGTQISFWRDQEVDVPSFGVTPLPAGENVRYSLNQFHLVENGMSARIDFKHVGDLTEGFEIRFLNRNTWRPDYVIMGVDGEIYPSIGKKPIVINADGVTDIDQARAIGQHLARAKEYRNMTVSITTELTGKLVDYGNVLHLPDGIVCAVATLEIESHIDDVVTFIGDIGSASVNKIVFSHDQARATKTIDCVVLETNKVRLLSVPTIDDVVVNFSPKTQGSTFSASLFDELDGTPIDVIVTNMQPKSNNQVLINAVIADSRVFAA